MTKLASCGQNRCQNVTRKRYKSYLLLAYVRNVWHCQTAAKLLPKSAQLKITPTVVTCSNLREPLHSSTRPHRSPNWLMLFNSHLHALLLIVHTIHSWLKQATHRTSERRITSTHPQTNNPIFVAVSHWSVKIGEMTASRIHPVAQRSPLKF